MSSRSSSKSRSFLSPSIPGYYRVGWVKSAHGIRGEVFIGLDAGRADWRENVGELLLCKRREHEDKKMPSPSPAQDLVLQRFTIDVLRAHKNGLIVRFKEVRDRNQSEDLRGAQVFIPEEALKAKPGEPIFLHQIRGFALVDVDSNPIGTIADFSTNGAQDLLVVRTPSREALIPFVDAFLVEIDFDRRQVRMDLPPGLVEE